MIYQSHSKNTIHIGTIIAIRCINELTTMKTKIEEKWISLL